MAYPFPPPTVQVSSRIRFDVAEFEPLLDSNEAAALLRWLCLQMHLEVQS
jgi:hypothetical protein